MLENFLMGLATALSLKTLLFMLLVLCGIIGGNSRDFLIIAMALMLPLTSG